MQIEVELATQYGNRVIVPVCETAKTFAKLASTTTLRPITVELVKKLGYEVRVKQTLPVTL